MENRQRNRAALFFSAMSGYTKLFQDIVTSTIWSESSDCRVLWITMLALKDRHNVCPATVPALAKFVGITLEETEKYLEKFQQPDRYSRSQEHEGRRIAPCDGGWLILNGEKYQDKLSIEDRREQNRVAVAKHRAKRSAKMETRKKRLPERKPSTERIEKHHTRDGYQPHPQDCDCMVCRVIEAEAGV